METVYTVLFNKYKTVAGEKFDGFFYHLVDDATDASGLKPHYEEHFKGKSAKEVVSATVNNGYKPLNFVIEQNKLKTVAEINPKKHIILSEVKSENDTVIGYYIFTPRTGAINTVSREKLFATARNKTDLSSMLQNAYIREVTTGNYIVVRKNFLDYPVQVYKKVTEPKKPIRHTAEPKVENKPSTDEFAGFTPEQKRELMNCKQSGVDVELIRNKKYTPKQMRILWVSKRDGRLPEEFADPSIDAEVMQYYDSRILTKADAERMRPLTIIRPMRWQPTPLSPQVLASKMDEIKTKFADLERKEKDNITRITSEIKSEGNKKGLRGIDTEANMFMNTVSNYHMGSKYTPQVNTDDLQSNFMKALDTFEQALNSGISLSDIIISPNISAINARLKYLLELNNYYMQKRLSYNDSADMNTIKNNIKTGYSDFEECKLDASTVQGLTDNADEAKQLEDYTATLNDLMAKIQELQNQVEETKKKAAERNKAEIAKEQKKLNARLAKKAKEAEEGVA